MSDHIESYNIYNSLKFNLINKMRFGGLLKAINTEYEYFKTDSITNSPDFSINIYDYNSFFYKSNVNISEYLKYKDYYYFAELNVDKTSIEVLRFRYNLKGLRKLFGFSALKNIFVRSLISIHMIRQNSTLVHGGGVSYNGKGSIFVGRPGVFKTTIVMKLIKNSKFKYLGEENILLKDNQVYSFPLNKKSFNYKVQNWNNENAGSPLEKLLLGLDILIGKENIPLEISKPVGLENVFLVEKGEEFSIKKVTFTEEVLEDLINNEMLELRICPTHSLSGVHTNIIEKIYEHYFKSTPLELNNIWDQLRTIFTSYIKNKNIYRVTVPLEYSNEIHLKLSEYIR